MENGRTASTAYIKETTSAIKEEVNNIKADFKRIFY